MSDRQLGHATVLTGARGGKYPSGNSLLVAGREETVLIDPSLALVERPDRPRVDRLLLSHCHEDHLAGVHLYPEAPVHLHVQDRLGLLSLQGLMAIYGIAPEAEEAFREFVVGEFHWVARPDARGFEDGAQFDLGGGVRLRVIHAPGHTRGHSFFQVEPDDILYVGDVDLSSFGPYYGDAWSSLVDFERTLAALRDMPARWYATFHHAGVVEGQGAFRERLARFAAVIAEREQRLLAYLAVPRTLAEMVAHRFVFRPYDAAPFLEDIERRCLVQHLERLMAGGRVREVEVGRFLSAA